MYRKYENIACREISYSRYCDTTMIQFRWFYVTFNRLLYVQRFLKKCWFYFKDVNECASSPCVNGTCSDRVNGYVCNCTLGYTGSRCNIGKLKQMKRNTLMCLIVI